MAAIKDIKYAPDYPWGVGTPGTGSGYLLSSAGAVGDTTINVDTGTGTILVGDRVTFAGHTRTYRVASALSGGSFTIEHGLTAIVADNATVTLGPTWTTVTDWLEEDFEPGVESPISVRFGEGGEEQDGVELQGSALITGSNLPTAGARTWIAVVPVSGTTEVRGGLDGCRIKTGKSGIRPLGGGPAYTRVEWSATGAARGDLVEDAAA